MPFVVMRKTLGRMTCEDRRNDWFFFGRVNFDTQVEMPKGSCIN